MRCFKLINTELYTDFRFSKVNFNKFHYTDNRIGSSYHYFAYMEKGTAKIVSENKTILIKEGDLFHIPKNTSYQSYWYGNEEISFYSYGCNNLLSHDTRFLDIQIVECPKKLAISLTSIPTDVTDIHIKDVAEFFATVAMLLPYMKKRPLSNANDILIKAKKYLCSNPYCSNNELAKECKISLPYLYKLFKSLEQGTPNTYRQKVLCDKAKDILTTTDLPIEQISSMLSFSSSGYFRKIFKEHTGITPSEFRKSYYF